MGRWLSAEWHWYWTSVFPNLVASLIWGLPAFVTHHVLIKRHITRTQKGGSQT